MTVAVPAFKFGAEGEFYNVAYGDVWTPPTTGFEANQTRVPVGTIVKMYDKELGMGEFIFLKGVATVVLGTSVCWADTITTSTPPAYQTVLAPTTTLTGRPIAFASGAIVAGTFGWFQISGHAVVLSNGTFAQGAALYMQAAGVVSTTAAVSAQVVNARTCSANGVPSGNLGIAFINRPFIQGAIT